VKAEAPLSPAVRKIVTENKVDPASIAGTGKDGRLTKGDVIEQLSKPIAMPAAAPASAGGEERVKMSRLRLTIARRLKEAQNTAAMLTTFNEVDMSAVMALRNEFKEMFEKKHGVKLGFMSFFAKAVIQALKDVPAVNAEIDGEDLVYKNYYHLGVAVGTEKGLVVPVVRDADRMSFATIEKTIADYGKKARDGQLQIADMQGGTFTISNGGVYGSLMSTPILNAPQSGILGMHKIQQRPVAIDGQVVIRPMMYLALSYDHRIVDGKEAVTFLVRVKESLEDPQRALLDL
jgi:2-oxoglutarate dehydrogenase E2 component (dihydrolipoamide succinyltransferase)